jgi:hypothetical protein
MKSQYGSIRSTAAAKGGDHTQNNPIGRKWSALALGGLLFASVLALSPSSVKAQCPQGWNITGQWGLKQRNQAEPNAMTLTTKPNRNALLQGSASYGTGAKQVTGRVKGSINGTDVYIEIGWSNGLTGIYEGKISPQGKIEGAGWEARSPSKKVSWYSTRSMTCR